MFFLFALISFALMLVDKKQSKRFFSPVSVFCISWFLMVSMYELKLIEYYPLSPLTYVVLILSEIVFCVFCWVGFKGVVVSPRDCCFKQEDSVQKKLLLAIAICSIVGSIPILHGFVLLMRDFSFDFVRILTSSDYLYAQHTAHGNSYLKIPYLHAFAYAALVYSSIYLKKYGFRFFAVYPLALIGLLTIITGSRYFIVLGTLQFVCPLLLGHVNEAAGQQKAKAKRTIMPVVFAAFAVFALFLVYRFSTEGRSRSITGVSYASPLLESLMNRFGDGVFKTYHYFSSPVGILNAYLDDPYLLPGRETFAFLYRILKKFGVDMPTEVSRPYSIPISSNAGTFIKSFMIDFGPLFVVAIVVFSFIVGKEYKKAITGHVQAIALYSVLFSLLGMSFYSWYLSETVYWLEMMVFVSFTLLFKKRRRTSLYDKKSIASVF